MTPVELPCVSNYSADSALYFGKYFSSIFCSRLNYQRYRINMTHYHQKRMLIPSQAGPLAQPCNTQRCPRIHSVERISQKVLSDDESHRLRRLLRRPRHLGGAKTYPSCRDGVLCRSLRTDMD